MGMRTIDSTRFLAGGSVMVVRLVEVGKTDPFRVQCTVKNGDGKVVQAGTLGAFATQAEAREIYQFNLEQAEVKQWVKAGARVRLLEGIPAPPGVQSSTSADVLPRAPKKIR